MKTLPIGEARRRLPELVRRVAQGYRTVAIGRRGRPEVVLVPAGSVTLAVARRPLQGLVEIIGSADDLESSQHELRRDLDTSLKRTVRMIAGRARTRRS